jgi:hypothetical protein
MRASAIMLLFAAGCVLRTSDPETVTCAAAGCPDGQACVEDECVAISAAPDAGVPAVADAAPAEQVPAADAAPVALESCDQVFGAADGYLLCGEDAASCTFFARTAGGTCADQCALFASECVGGYDSNAGAPCTIITEDGCLATHTTQTCICARPAAGQ